VSDKLFSIRCETCGSRLAVRDACLIGHILSCPKCSSMVMVQAPEGWSPDGAAAPSASSVAPAGSSAAISASASAVATAPAPPPPSGLDSTTAAEAATLRDRWADAASVPAPPSADAVADIPLPSQDWLSPRQRWMRTYGTKIGAAVAGVLATVALWYAFSPSPPAVEAESIVEPAAPIVEPLTEATEEPLPDLPPIKVPPQPAPPIAAPPTAAPRASEPDVPSDVPPAVPNGNVAQGEPPVPPANPPIPPDKPVGEAPAANVAPRPERDPLPVIDVAARLNDPILKLDYPKTPLVDFLGMISTFSTIPITLDVDAMIAAGIRPELPVSVRSGNKKTVAEALEMALAKPKLRYVVVDQHILVTTVESDAPSAPARREVNDLIGADPAAAERLAMIVKQLVEPLSWQTERTTTSLRVDGSALVIVQSPRVVRKIDSLLAALRAARRDPVGVAVAPPTALQSPHFSARGALSKKITLNYTTPTKLEKVLARLAEASKLTVVVNWQALANDNVGPATEVRMSATDVPVEKAFAALVDPMQLAFRVVDGHTIEITTQDELAGHPELAAFPLADLATDAAKLSAIMDRVKQQFGPPVGTSADSTAAVSATTDAGIAWYLDEPSKTLFLLAPQDTHIQLEAVFREARGK
jgi:hypothetical protein